MLQRGKKSTAALASVTAFPLNPRQAAPEHLTPEQRAIWDQTVNAKPADWFGPEHRPLLEAYCRHLCNAATIGKAIMKVEPEWLLDDEGIRRHERLFTMHDREMRAASSLATRMRLTQQAITDTRKAGVHSNVKAGRKPWDPPDE